MSLLEELKQIPLIAILRGVTGVSADRTVDALCEGGIRFVEVTMNTDGASQMIERWRTTYGSRLRIGAGTVLSVQEAERAAQAGAEYLISPHLDEAIVSYALDHGLGVFPGAMTPTEIVRAH